MSEREITVGDIEKLRAPFKPEEIHKLPKSTNKDNQKGRCNECGGFHGLPAVHIDYVGHAVLTGRLLDVDPMWNWEPLSYDENGLPYINKTGDEWTLWIKLTVLGITRFGVGSVAKNKHDAEKELIGDALRNAAMRFGVALDLWMKKDRFDAENSSEPRRRNQRPKETKEETDVDPNAITQKQLNYLHKLLNNVGVRQREDVMAKLTAMTGRNIESSKDLTKEETIKIIDQLQETAPSVDKETGEIS